MVLLFIIIIIASVWIAIAHIKALEKNSEKFREKAGGKPFCPFCGCTDLSANSRGFSMITGSIGSKDVYVTCLKCGQRWKAGEYGFLYKDE